MILTLIVFRSIALRSATPARLAGSLGRAREREDAVGEVDGSESQDVSVMKSMRTRDFLLGQGGPVLAVEVLNRRFTSRNSNAGMAPRDACIVEEDGGQRIATDDRLPVAKRDLAAEWPQETVGKLGPRSLLGFPRFGGASKRIAESMNRADLSRLIRIADGRANLGDQARERAVRNERPSPEILVHLRLRNGRGPSVEEKKEQVESLR